MSDDGTRIQITPESRWSGIGKVWECLRFCQTGAKSGNDLQAGL